MSGSVLHASLPAMHPGVFLAFGPVTVSLGNFIVIAAMVVLFVAALLLPFLPDGSHR